MNDSTTELHIASLSEKIGRHDAREPLQPLQSIRVTGLADMSLAPLRDQLRIWTEKENLRDFAGNPPTAANPKVAGVELTASFANRLDALARKHRRSILDETHRSRISESAFLSDRAEGSDALTFAVPLLSSREKHQFTRKISTFLDAAGELDVLERIQHDTPMSKNELLTYVIHARGASASLDERIRQASAQSENLLEIYLSDIRSEDVAHSMNWNAENTSLQVIIESMQENTSAIKAHVASLGQAQDATQATSEKRALLERLRERAELKLMYGGVVMQDYLITDASENMQFRWRHKKDEALRGSFRGSEESIPLKGYRKKGIHTKKKIEENNRRLQNAFTIEEEEE